MLKCKISNGWEKKNRFFAPFFLLDLCFYFWFFMPCQQTLTVKLWAAATACSAHCLLDWLPPLEINVVSDTDDDWDIECTGWTGGVTHIISGSENSEDGCLILEDFMKGVWLQRKLRSRFVYSAGNMLHIEGYLSLLSLSLIKQHIYISDHFPLFKWFSLYLIKISNLLLF